MRKSTDSLAPRPLDPRQAVRGTYYDRMGAGTNIVLIEPDLIDTFPDSDSVNEALRGLKNIANRSVKVPEQQGKAASATR